MDGPLLSIKLSNDDPEYTIQPQDLKHYESLTYTYMVFLLPAFILPHPIPKGEL